ncbi:hypothetical protein NDU88_001748 [Pleurodeles waltl]|uniref:Uncharacterized protein n=1 Tax=Pleurodeles waltl TaxID=8319 RepID=A0AAV7RCH3_PLEWA|nr:hypothetical protein NDU88_001748 [Pleurodeles waltl]
MYTIAGLSFSSLYLTPFESPAWPALHRESQHSLHRLMWLQSTPPGHTTAGPKARTSNQPDCQPRLLFHLQPMSRAELQHQLLPQGPACGPATSSMRGPTKEGGHESRVLPSWGSMVLAWAFPRAKSSACLQYLQAGDLLAPPRYCKVTKTSPLPWGTPYPSAVPTEADCLSEATPQLPQGPLTTKHHVVRAWTTLTAGLHGP